MLSLLLDFVTVHFHALKQTLLILEDLFVIKDNYSVITSTADLIEFTAFNFGAPHFISKECQNFT